MKFEFKPPSESDPKGKTGDDFEEEKGQAEVDEEERSMGEESLEGTWITIKNSPNLNSQFYSTATTEKGATLTGH